MIARVGAATALLIAVATLAGCGSASAPSPPAGVDELVIPTPSPDPADFVPRVDNPWFPLAPGTIWTYDVVDADGTHQRRVSVAARTRQIAGVVTTAVVTVDKRRRYADYYAQDQAGNVWWFGRSGQWQAGTDDAEAGVIMLAKPRVGDGYREAYLPGVVEDVATIESTTDTAVAPSGEYDDVVRTQNTSRLDPGTTAQRSYAPGVGLVSERVVSGNYHSMQLVAVKTATS